MKEKETAFSLTHTEQFRVRFNETDALGIVWHGNYISYFEEGREAFGRKFGLSYGAAMAAGFSTPIVKTSCEHLLPLRYGDIFTVEIMFKNTDSAKIIFEYKIYNTENQAVCKGQTVQVFWDADGNLQLYAPDFFVEWKKRNAYK